MKYARFSSFDGLCKFFVSETGSYSDAYIRTQLCNGLGIEQVSLLGHMDSGPSIHWEDRSVYSFGLGRNGVMSQFYGYVFSETGCEQTFESWKRLYALNGNVSLEDVAVESVTGEVVVKKVSKPKAEPSVE